MTIRELRLVESRPRGDEATRELVDRYVEFVAARCRPNTVAAMRSDLGVFFSVVDKPPVEVTARDVLEFIAAQRRPRGDGKVVRLADGEAGLSARTIKRRVATVSGFFAARTHPRRARTAGRPQVTPVLARWRVQGRRSLPTNPFCTRTWPDPRAACG